MKQREVGEAYEASTSALEAAKGQRLSLRRAIAGLEEALAAPDDADGLGGPDGLTMDDAYAACDAVVFPSTWEGFGAPLVEASLHRRPLAVGDYPVAAELAAFGFRWFPADNPTPLKAFLDRPDQALLAANSTVARRHFSLDALTRQLAALLDSAGWS